MDELLEETALGWVYWEHSKHPLDIQVFETDENINITVTKTYKQHVLKEFRKSFKKVGTITKQQRRGLILDTIEIFLR